MSDASPRTPGAAVFVAEGLGTLLLVLAVIATALFSAGFGEGTDAANKGVGFVGVALAIGLAVAAAISVFGPISGGHFNPAVTLGLAAAGRFPWSRTPGYIASQIVGGAVATTIIVLIGLFAPEGWLEAAQDDGFASNGWGALSPSGFELGAVMITETVFTALFVIVILGVTHARTGNPTLAALIVGLTLTVIHLATIPIDNTSVNPARSIATAVYGGGEALAQLWVFIVFPIVGALLAGVVFRALYEAPSPAPQ